MRHRSACCSVRRSWRTCWATHSGRFILHPPLFPFWVILINVVFALIPCSAALRPSDWSWRNGWRAWSREPSVWALWPPQPTYWRPSRRSKRWVLGVEWFECTELIYFHLFLPIDIQSFHAELHQNKQHFELFSELTQKLIAVYPNDDTSRIKKMTEAINQRWVGIEIVEILRRLVLALFCDSLSRPLMICAM